MDERLAGRFYIITALMIIVTCGVAQAITVDPSGVLKKGDNFTITASFSGLQSWSRNGVILSICLIVTSSCTANTSNMVFSANSSTSTSTITITNADYGLNGGEYAVAGQTKTLSINSPIVTVAIINENIGNKTATLVARIACIFPTNELQVIIYKFSENGVNSSEVLDNNNLVAADNSSCASYESAFNVSKTYNSGGVAEKFRVKVCGKHLSLNTETCSGLSSLITFEDKQLCNVSDIKRRTAITDDDTNCKAVCPVTVVVAEVVILIVTAIVLRLTHDKIWFNFRCFVNVCVAINIIIILFGGIISGVIVGQYRKDGTDKYCCEVEVVVYIPILSVLVMEIFVFIVAVLVFTKFEKDFKRQDRENETPARTCCTKWTSQVTPPLEISDKVTSTNENSSKPSNRKSINGDAGPNNLLKFSCNSRQEIAASAPIDTDRPDPLDPNRP